MRLSHVLVTVFFFAAPAVALAGKPKRLKLKKTKTSKLDLRLGFGLTGAIPEEAWSAKLGRSRLLFLDLDGDGKLSPDKDGLARRGLPFVVPIPEVLFMAKGQWTLRFEEKLLILEPTSNGLPRAMLAAGDALADIRLRAGLPLLRLDKNASRACDAHIKYLIANKVSRGMGMHDETPGRPGYTPAGAQAGKSACLSPGSPGIIEAIRGWYRTAWHGAPILDPSLKTVGLMFRNEISMIYPVDGGGLGVPFHHPADGAIDIPPMFSPRGEIPNPLPGTKYARDCGFPIYVKLPYNLNRSAVKASLVPLKKSGKAWKAGSPVDGVVSCPSRPANPNWPSNSGLALFLPRNPLASKTRYRARFEIAGAEPIEFTFTTGS